MPLSIKFWCNCNRPSALVNPKPASNSNTSSEVITTKGCISTSKLPTGRSRKSSVSVSKGTNCFVLSIVNVAFAQGNNFHDLKCLKTYGLLSLLPAFVKNYGGQAL